MDVDIPSFHPRGSSADQSEDALTHSDGVAGAAAQRHGQRLAWKVLVPLVVVAAMTLFASAAHGALSLYQNGTLVAGTNYNSIVRPWYGNEMINQSSQNIGAGRLWAYNSGYIFDITKFVYAGEYWAVGCANQSARNWCSSSNTRSPAGCGGLY